MIVLNQDHYPSKPFSSRFRYIFTCASVSVNPQIFLLNTSIIAFYTYFSLFTAHFNIRITQNFFSHFITHRSNYLTTSLSHPNDKQSGRQNHPIPIVRKPPIIGTNNRPIPIIGRPPIIGRNNRPIPIIGKSADTDYYRLIGTPLVTVKLRTALLVLGLNCIK